MKTKYFPAFLDLLDALIDRHYNGVNFQLATKAGLDPALVNRVLSGEREPTPMFVGQVARVFNRKQAAELIKAYLQGVASEVAKHQLAHSAEINRPPSRWVTVKISQPPQKVAG